MTIWKRKNFSGKDPKNVGVDDGDELIECNCGQKAPYTEICQGLTGLIFTDCMLQNCVLPLGAVKNRGNIPHVEFCSNLKPGFTDQTCSENCSHVVDTDTVTMDGIVVDTVYHYKHKRM